MSSQVLNEWIFLNTNLSLLSRTILSLSLASVKVEYIAVGLRDESSYCNLKAQRVVIFSMEKLSCPCDSRSMHCSFSRFNLIFLDQ
jgi:hypothetical protein